MISFKATRIHSLKVSQEVGQSISREMAMNLFITNSIHTWLTCISVGAERNVGKALVVDAEEEKEEETE